MLELWIFCMAQLLGIFGCICCFAPALPPIVILLMACFNSFHFERVLREAFPIFVSLVTGNINKGRKRTQSLGVCSTLDQQDCSIQEDLCFFF